MQFSSKHVNQKNVELELKAPIQYEDTPVLQETLILLEDDRETALGKKISITRPLSFNDTVIM